mmetsp:Transcript_36199/g.58130  ORF Transcript_36199/g.58130 Transcript_36199/m.58130 type:complete len:333 (+) Transcript_36199:120-1118(+)
MADPGKIISMFWIDDELESDIYLDGVLSVVDAKYLTHYLKHDKAEQLNDAQSLQIIHQIAYADKVLLNKLDLVNADDTAALRALIHSINSVGDILSTTKSRVESLDDVLYLRAYDIVQPPNLDMLVAQTKGNQHGNDSKKKRCNQCECQSKEHQLVHTVDALISVLDDELLETDGHEHQHECDHTHDDEEQAQGVCAHDANIKSLMMETVGKCVDLDKVDNWLSELLWNDQYQTTANMNIEDESKQNAESGDTESMQIYRMKAVLPAKNGDNHYLSAVQDLYEIEKGNVRWMDEKQAAQGYNQCRCKMVVIGKYLDEAVLRKGFDSIFIDDE